MGSGALGALNGVNRESVEVLLLFLFIWLTGVLATGNGDVGNVIMTPTKYVRQTVKPCPEDQMNGLASRAGGRCLIFRASL